MDKHLINKKFLEIYPNNFKTENVSIFLYSIIKCVRPLKIIEIGCGYSTFFISEAIEDIKRENLRNDRFFKLEDLTDNYFKYSGGFYVPDFYVVDDFSSVESSETIKILETVDLLKNIKFYNKGIDDFLRENCDNFDLVWLDCGSPSLEEYKKYFNTFSSKLNSGGIIVIHSTISNLIARVFISELKLELKNTNFELISFVEPHKRNQNSFTIIKKHFDYPVYSVEP